MRPAFFGEVVFPKSRAVDIDFGDDFDEDVPPANKVVLESKKDWKEVLSTLKYLIFACGSNPSNFAKVYLIPDNPKAEVIFSVKIFSRLEMKKDPKDGPIEIDNRFPPISVLDFYHVTGTNSLIGLTTSKHAPHPEVAQEVAAKVFDHLSVIASTLRVFAFDFKPSALFQSTNRESIEERLSTFGLVRVLMSDKEKSENKDHLRRLETPNVIDGLAAAVMTRCEMNGIRGITYVLYGQDASDGLRTNVEVYRTILDAAEFWKPFLKQESDAVVKQKLDSVIRQKAPLNSMFG